MNLIRLVAAATSIELSLAAAVLAAAGIGGWRSGWLDVANVFAPITLAMALCAAALAYICLDHGGTRDAILSLAAFAILYGLAVTVPEFARRPRSTPASARRMRILAANVWRDNPFPGAAVAEILARDADAVFLQESLGTLSVAMPLLRARYPYASEAVDSGAQILVKTPITAEGRHPRSRTPDDLDLVWVQTTTPDGTPVTLVTTHFSWPFPPGRQAAHRRVLADRVSRLPGAELILAGDFNTTPWSFAMRRQDRALAPLRRVTRAWFSWPARLTGLGRSWPVPLLPIDHIYAGPGWTGARLTRVRIPGSDHFATEAVFVRS
jgi:endonuclease/exonuclease/phosphatase (EEP) superfamily protein YafD